MATRQQNILAAAERRRQNTIASGNTTQKNLEDTNVQNLRNKTVKTAPVKSTGPIPLVKPRTLGQIASNSITASTKDIGRPTSSAEPTGSLITPQNYRNFGLFQNQSTGGFTNAQGVSIDPMTGKPFVKQTAEVVPTEQQNAEALIYGQQQELNTLGQQYLGQKDLFPTSLEAQVQEQAAQAQRQFEASKANLNAQAQQVTEQAAQEGAAVKNTAEAQMQGLVGGRQGPSSTGNVSAQERLKQEMTKNLATIDTSRQNSLAQIDEAQAQLDYAKKTNDRGLIENAQKALDYAKLQAKQIETDYVNALTMASEEERNVQAQKNANLGVFTAMVDGGEEMSTQAISNFAQNLGIDFEMANDYYTGAQNIRDNKALDEEGKRIELANLNYDFNQKLQGLQSKEAQAINDYITLAQSGNYTPEQLQQFAISMNIPNEKNPIFMADLKIKQAEAKIRQAEANGELVNPLDQAALANAWADYYKKTGQAVGTIPSGGGSPETTAFPEGYGIRFGFEDGSSISSGKRPLTQCGQFVNDVLGLKMGDDYSTKYAYVDKSIVFPEPGMAFVYPTNAPEGHTGIVEYYNPDTQMVGVADVNGLGDNKARHREVPLSQILNGGGFVPSRGVPLSYGLPSAESITATVQNLVKAVADKEIVAGEIERLVQSGDRKALQDYVKQTTFSSLGQKEEDKLILRSNMVATGDLLKQYMQEYVDAGGDLGIFSGSLVSARNKIGNSADPDIQRIGQLMLLQLEDFGRSQTGAAIQDFEKKNFKALLPNIFDGQNLAEAKIDAFAEAQATYAETILRTKLGDTVYNSLYGETKSQQPQTPEEDPDDALYQSLSNYNDPDYLEAQQSWVNPGAIGGYLTQ